VPSPQGRCLFVRDGKLKKGALPVCAGWEAENEEPLFKIGKKVIHLFSTRGPRPRAHYQHSCLHNFRAMTLEQQGHPPISRKWIEAMGSSSNVLVF